MSGPKHGLGSLETSIFRTRHDEGGRDVLETLPELMCIKSRPRHNRDVVKLQSRSEVVEKRSKWGQDDARAR